MSAKHETTTSGVSITKGLILPIRCKKNLIDTHLTTFAFDTDCDWCSFSCSSFAPLNPSVDIRTYDVNAKSIKGFVDIGLNLVLQIFRLHCEFLFLVTMDSMAAVLRFLFTSSYFLPLVLTWEVALFSWSVSFRMLGRSASPYGALAFLTNCAVNHSWDPVVTIIMALTWAWV